MLRRSSVIIILLKDLLFLLVFTTTNFETSFCKTTNDHDKTLFITCPEIEKQALLSFKQSLEDPDDLLSSWNDDHEVDCCKWKGVVCNNLTGHVHELHLRGRYYGYELPPPFEAHGLRGKINSSLLNLKYLNYLDLSLNDFGETIPSFIGSFASMEYLNLSEAGFLGAIPHTIGNLSNLRALNLQSWFRRTYSDNLDWLPGLSKLELLDIDFVDLSRASNWLRAINTLPSLSEVRLRGCNLDWSASIDAVNFSSLHTLDMSFNHFNFSSVEFPRWTLQLTGLTFLDLRNNFIEGPIPSISNTTKLEYIALSQNYLNSTIPDWLYACNNLEFVYLGGNSLVGTISNDISNLSSLVDLDLSQNNLSGNIPPGVWRSCKMRDLSLSNNKLQGEISDFLRNMSDCFVGSLEFLRLFQNQISGHLSNRLGNLKNLLRLDLGYNSISGGIPDVFGELLNLEALFLNGNNFVGNLPESLGKLLNLIYIDLAYNSLEGVVTEIHLMDLKNMQIFSAAGNNQLNFKVSPDWIPPFQLSELYLSYTALNGPFPSWLEAQKKIEYIDISNSGIHGPVPRGVWNISYVDLSNNNLYGSIPNNLLSGYADLGSNQFSGPLPRIGRNVFFLDLSNNSISGGISNIICDDQNTTEPYVLQILNLNGNQLSGELPDCWMRLKNLNLLNLGDNDMHGSISPSITLVERLQILILSNNRFSGRIPPLMLSSRELVMVDLSDNNFHGNLPKWESLDSEPSIMSPPAPYGLSGNPRKKRQGLSSLGFIILRSNQLSGEIDSNICSFNSIQVLDISNNNLYGTIPGCFYNFTAMVQNTDIDRSSNNTQRRGSTGLSRGSLSVDIVTKGQRRSYDVLLPLVVTIDLSNNNLSGNFPLDFTRLVSLRQLNLSRNHLTGSIPRNIGDMKQLESLDLSINSLTGEIPNSFTVMSSLNYLNLSYNNLTGIIPESTQIQSMDASSFVGNNLCGPPLTASKCGARDHDDGGGVVSHEEVEVDWFIVLLSLGFAVGLSSFLVVMTFGKSLREDYFEMLDDIFEKIMPSLIKKSKRR